MSDVHCACRNLDIARQRLEYRTSETRVILITVSQQRRIDKVGQFTLMHVRNLHLRPCYLVLSIVKEVEVRKVTLIGDTLLTAIKDIYNLSKKSHFLCISVLLRKYS